MGPEALHFIKLSIDGDDTDTGHTLNSKTPENEIIQLLDLRTRTQTLDLDCVAWNSTSVSFPFCVILVKVFYFPLSISHLRMKKMSVLTS